MISLNRLEKEVQLRLAAGQPLDDAMSVLAGLQRIQYVFVYPESNDLVLAGPAGDWTTGAEEIPVSAQTGQPIVLLDDLVVVFRQMMSHPNASFGCRITPTQEALARVQKCGEGPPQSRSSPGSGNSGWRSSARNWASRTSTLTAWTRGRGQPR